MSIILLICKIIIGSFIVAFIALVFGMFILSGRISKDEDNHFDKRG